MGVLSAVNLSNLVAIDAGGLLKALQQITETVQDQQDALTAQQEALRAQTERIDAFENMLGSGNEAAKAAAAQSTPEAEDMARAGHKMSVVNAMSGIQALEGSVEALVKRLDLAEQHHGEWAKRSERAEQARQDGQSQLDKRLTEERETRTALDQSVRSLEQSFRIADAKFDESCKGVEELRQQLTEEFRRTSGQFEARVRVAEDKVSECRQEAKSFREKEDAREYELSEVHAQLRKISNASQHALNNSGQVMGAQRGNSLLSENFEAQLQELQSRVTAKASESVVDAIRSDLELNSRVLQDAVKAVSERLADQEGKVRDLAKVPQRRPEQGLPPSSDVTAYVNEKAQASANADEAEHCLLCHNDRSLSPSRVILGTDNQVYGHLAADASAEAYSDTQTISTLRASPSALQNFVRPRPTPATCPRPKSAPHSRLHPEVALSMPAGSTTAASVSSLQKSGRRPGRDVKSKRIGDMVGLDTGWTTQSGTSSRALSRPTSAQLRPSRPLSATAQREGVVRPSSAGGNSFATTADSSSLAAAGESQQSLPLRQLATSQSLPTLEPTSSKAL